MVGVVVVVFVYCYVFVFDVVVLGGVCWLAFVVWVWVLVSMVVG